MCSLKRDKFLNVDVDGVKMKRLIYIFPLLDNVHFQQGAQISQALVDQAVDFEAMVNID